ncbi:MULTISPECIES: GNAT family N-acetyltransferase [unclassified Luteimonas]
MPINEAKPEASMPGDWSRDAVLRGELLPLERCPDLATDWIALQDVAACSPFASWQWVSTWLEHLPAGIRPMVFRARDAHGGVAALALLVDAPEQGGARWLGRRSWHLQETGDAGIDEITIEYAGLLARPGWLPAAWRSLFDALDLLPRDWRRLRISTSAQGEAIAAALPQDMQATSVRSRPCYQVDLAAVRDAPGGYLEVLGRKVRGSLRQSLRAYESLGPLRAETAADVRVALDWFDAFEQLHTQHWQSRGAGGCFASPFFRRFHRTLIERSSDDGFARIVRVTAGDALVGYLYNLGWQGNVYYYNAGMNYGLLQRHDRPGIASLYAAVEQAAAAGESAFDFLAGDQEYKRRLSSTEHMLHSIDVRRSGMRATAERIGAGLAQRGTLGVPLGEALAMTPSTQEA